MVSLEELIEYVDELKADFEEVDSQFDVELLEQVSEQLSRLLDLCS